MTTDHFVYRDLSSDADYAACVALQRATWGDDFRELVGPALLRVIQKVGGVVAGAFDADGNLTAFVFGITGFKDGELAHWSHMLAVRDTLRNRGLGRGLKLFQRERVRALGVRRMYWTYDPLVSRNAHLNLNVLGTRINSYVPDMYGPNTQSLTDNVIGTDRFIVVWTLDRPVPNGAAPPWPDAPVVTSGDPDALPAGDLILVELPEDIQRLKQRDPDGARQWRRTTRRALMHYLARGYRVTGLARDANARRAAYVLDARDV